ncbi:endoglucanase 10-like isoform X2 [Primulina tabacum]|uniref:endoglucanase 10-like isoform X2 n=2 Tax=Primulina tabacum TaxID=48773 RepID=UPI003F590B7C
MLSWTILEYGDQMKAVNQLEPARDSLKWVTEYLVNVHPSHDVLYIQMGNPKLDHRCWARPENMTKQRPLAQVDASAPGTEVAAETAATLASASQVFKDIDSSYSSLLLWHAKQLFTFSGRGKESYSISIPNVQNFYNSTSYRDELLWAASWRYHATGERFYFEYVTGKNGEDFADWVAGMTSWLVLRKSAEAVMCNLLPGSPTGTASKTNSLIWINEWNTLQHPVALAFLAVLYSDCMLTSRTTKIYCSGSYFTPLDNEFEICLVFVFCV